MLVAKESKYSIFCQWGDKKRNKVKKSGTINGAAFPPPKYTCRISHVLFKVTNKEI
jgi:hypothetical protein